MPIITLTSDWGNKDHYVGSVKGAILNLIPNASIIDISHEIPAFNLYQASFILKNCYKNFPTNTIHIIGVNSIAAPDTPHTAILKDGHYFISSDNGIFSLLFDTLPDKIIEIKKQIGSPIVLFVGRLVYYKGVEYLIRAFKNINAQLVLVGSGPLENDLKHLAKDLEIEERVHFLNNIPDADLKAFYHACDIFVLPSIEKTECFGLVQLEAMACGKPVISTNLPTGVPWINQHKKTGLVVPPKDVEALHQAIVFLLENEKLRNEYGKNGQERVKEFTIDLMVEKINNLYLSLCKL